MHAIGTSCNISWKKFINLYYSFLLITVAINLINLIDNRLTPKTESVLVSFPFFSETVSNPFDFRTRKRRREKKGGKCHVFKKYYIVLERPFFPFFLWGALAKKMGLFRGGGEELPS